MSIDVLGVHGIWKYAPAIPTDAAAALTKSWRSALQQRNLTVAVAYYSHHLQLDSQGASDDLEQLDRDRPGQVAGMLTAWMAATDDAPDDVAQGQVLAPVRQLASWFVARYRVDFPLANWFLATFMSEVLLYFDPYQSPRRAAARLEVATAMSAHSPRIVIAHSLGSVVAYETLWAYPLLTVELLITIGSPLGMPNVVFHNLDPAPASGRGMKPPGVSRWINIADPADLVALPRHLATRFDGIDADQEIAAGAFFTHNADQYLRTVAVRQAVRDHLAPGLTRRLSRNRNTRSSDQAD